MSKPLPKLSHMPFHIKMAIVESADTRTKFSIRRCSKELKTFIERSNIHFDTLLLRDFDESQTVRLEATIQENYSITLDFESRSPDGFIVKHHNEDTEKVVETGNFIDAALVKLLKLLRRFPKVYVDRFEVNVKSCCISDDDDHYQQILDSLEGCLMSLNRVISVKELVMKTGPYQRDIFRVLRFLKPTTLESITLGARECYPGRCIADMELDAVAGTIHWKQAKKLIIEECFHSLPVEDTSHFESVTCDVRELNTDMLRHIVNNFVVHSHWKVRKFVCDSFNCRVLHQYVSQFEREPRAQNVYRVSNCCKLRFLLLHHDMGTTVIITRVE